MLTAGPAKKVTVHLNEDTVSRTDFLANEILALLLNHGVAGATIIRPDAGFGSHHRLHTREGEGGIDTAQHMPLRIEFIDSPERIATILPLLLELVNDGVIEAHDTVILKAGDGRNR